MGSAYDPAHGSAYDPARAYRFGLDRVLDGLAAIIDSNGWSAERNPPRTS